MWISTDWNSKTLHEVIAWRPKSAIKYQKHPWGTDWSCHMPRPRLGVADVVQRIAKSIIGKQVVVLTQLQVQWNCNTIGLHTGIHVCFPRCRFPLVKIQQVTWNDFFYTTKNHSRSLACNNKWHLLSFSCYCVFFSKNCGTWNSQNIVPSNEAFEFQVNNHAILGSTPSPIILKLHPRIPKTRS